jgi:MFS family permease
VKRLRAYLEASLPAFRDVFANTALRRLELAWACSIVGTWAFTIAVVVFAYAHGGAAAVGIVGLVRWVAAGIVSPFGAVLGDRYDRRRVMVASDLVRAALIGGAAAAAYAGAPAALVYVFTGLMSIAGTAFRPAEAAFTPSLARTPEELSAANVVASSIESVGIFAGPALGGVLLAVSSPATVFVINAALVVASALFVIRIRGGDETPVPRRAEESVSAELLAGIRTIVAEPRLRLLVGLFSAQTFVDGLLGVLTVLVALKLLGAGTAAVGYLNAAVGVGGVLGALVAAGLVGRGKLAGDFGMGVALFGLPIALLAAWSSTPVALVLMGLIGVGNTLVDVSGMTLLQRSAPDDVLARVFGVLETLFLLTVGVGAVIAPAVVSALGTRGALVADGIVLPALAALAWPALSRIDREARVPAHRLDRLRRNPIFAPLPEATLERLAGALGALRVPAGEEVVRQGEPGDRFFIVDEGSAEALADGEVLSVLGPGDSFGEIALLREVPRTATVRARDDSVLLTLEREDFIPAVTGYAASLDSANAVIGMRLGPARAGINRA